MFKKIAGRAFFIFLLAALNVHAADLEKIRIAYPSGMNGIYPVVLERAGIAAKHGLDAEYTAFQNGPPMFEALAAGQIDAVVTSLLPIASYLAKQPGKLVAVAHLGYSSYSLLVPNGSAVRNISDLKGKKIAVSLGTETYVDLLSALKDTGLSVKDVQIINTPPNELAALLAQKAVDAAIIREPQATRAREQFNAQSVKNWPFRFLTVLSTDYLKTHPNAKERYVVALKEAVLYTAQNPEQAAEWFAEKLRTDAKFVKQTPNEDPLLRNVKSLKDVNIGITPEIRAINDRRLAEYVATGVLKQAVDLPQLDSK